MIFPKIFATVSVPLTRFLLLLLLSFLYSSAFDPPILMNINNRLALLLTRQTKIRKKKQLRENSGYERAIVVEILLKIK